ncbi:MAG: FAD-dependent oxidoreductase [Candidatus Thorarchaeota archaeon]
MEQVDYITNIEAFQLKSLPKSMIVIGGGALGVEFAQLFSFLLKITSNVQKNTGIKY